MKLKTITDEIIFLNKIYMCTRYLLILCKQSTTSKKCYLRYTLNITRLLQNLFHIQIV